MSSIKIFDLEANRARNFTRNRWVEVSIGFAHSLMSKKNGQWESSVPLEKMTISMTGNPKVNKFSFCVISNGKRDNYLEKTIQSIHSLGIGSIYYEIIVCGITKLSPSNYRFQYVPAPDFADAGRLGAMRQRMVGSSKFENIIFLDDDIQLQRGWSQNFDAFKKDWDLCAGRLINPDGSRYWDWTENKNGNLKLLPYDQTSRYVYVTGGYVMVKRKVFSRISWDVHKGFYAGEDVDFSQKAHRASLKIAVNQHCIGKLQYHHVSAGPKPTRSVQSNHTPVFPVKPPSPNKRVLIVYDSPNWAFHSQAKGLIKNKKLKDYNYTICSQSEFYNRNDIERFDVVFAMGAYGMSEPRFVKKLSRTKYVSMVHHDPHNVGYCDDTVANPILNREINFINNAEYHSSISKFIMLAWQKQYNISSFLLPSGIDTKQFKPSGLFKNDKMITVGWCGNKDKKLKGYWDIILPIMRRLEKSHNIKFIDQGFEKLVSHEKMPDFYKKIDLYVCASSHEGLPTPLLEASACGIPFVSTDVGIVKEIDNKGLNVIVQRTPQSFSNGVIKMIQDKKRMMEAGANNRNVVMTGWSWDVVSYIWEYFITCQIDKLKNHSDKREKELGK